MSVADAVAHPEPAVCHIGFRLLAGLRVASVLFALFFGPSPLHALDYTISPRPSWVRYHPVKDTVTEFIRSGGYASCFLLNDVQVNAHTRWYYHHYALKIISPAGLPEATKISIAFDPTYEKVSFHSLRIVRDGAVVDMMREVRVRSIQQEEDLERNLYDGRRTLIIFLEGVRAGDIVEYDYSQIGDNPIFDGRFMDIIELQWDSPVLRSMYRVFTSKSRPLFWKNSRTSVAPAVDTSGDVVQYEWLAQEVKPLLFEGETPGWFVSYPYVQISSYADWAEVSQWSHKQYPPVPSCRADAVLEIRRALDTCRNTQDSAVALLRFVQDDIRYLGIEMGVNSHRPHSPFETLKKRYGDCKDKSYLLTCLLASVGIPASPVLVSTRLKPEVNNRHPSPSVFNHVITVIALHGKRYWVDPTISHQRGLLCNSPAGDYGRGLVVLDRSDTLAVIPFDPDLSFMQVKETFDVYGFQGRTDFTVVSRYGGDRADHMREYLAQNGREVITHDFVNYYAKLFPGVSGAGDLTVTEHPDSDIIELRETYQIDDFWLQEDNTVFAKMAFHTAAGEINKPDVRIRKHPFSQAYPCNISQETVVNLPQKFGIAAEAFEKVDSMLRFTQYTRYNTRANSLVLNWTYSTRRDAIDAENVPAYVKTITAIENNTQYVFSKELKPPFSWGSIAGRFGTLISLGILTLVGVVLVCVKKLRHVR